MRTLFHVTVLAAALVAAGCVPAVVPVVPDSGDVADASVADAGRPVELLAVVDLPRSSATQGLSGTWYDAQSRTLYAIADTGAHLVPLLVSEDLKTFTVGAALPLTGRPSAEWDGEAVTRVGTEFYAVTVESGPLLERFDATGAYLGPVSVPAHYALQPVGNKGIESLSVSPSGSFLFLCNEAALTSDGAVPTSTTGTTVRLMRRELGSAHDEERAYRTEPLGPGTGGDMGVSEVLALSDTAVLVLERGYQAGYGNTVRLFRVDFSAGADVSVVVGLDATSPVLAKTLVLDFSTLPSDGVTNPGQQPNPILDNFEGLGLGPTLADGRRVLFVTSDDNARSTQVPRILVLSVRAL